MLMTILLTVFFVTPIATADQCYRRWVRYLHFNYSCAGISIEPVRAGQQHRHNSGDALFTPHAATLITAVCAKRCRPALWLGSRHYYYSTGTKEGPLRSVPKFRQPARVAPYLSQKHELWEYFVCYMATKRKRNILRPLGLHPFSTSVPILGTSHVEFERLYTEKDY